MTQAQTPSTTTAPASLIARWLTENLNTLSGMDDMQIARRFGYAQQGGIRQWKEGTRAVPPGAIFTLAEITGTHPEELFPLWAAQLLSTQSVEGKALTELAGRCVRPEAHALLARMKRAGIELTAITDEHLDLLRWIIASGHQRRDALRAMEAV
ncbi:hypothetical protein [Glycocaulis sp.]|uniref:hypothetical protein n=1 Tax=Glycocaulis sp. TaxID=1969725 RepID=UPI003D21C17E